MNKSESLQLPEIYEEMTENEKKDMDKLIAKHKRIKRQLTAFWSYVDTHREEVAQHIGANEGARLKEENAHLKSKLDEYKKDLDAFQSVATKYGCNLQELFDYIKTPQQISYFQRNAGRSVAKVSPSTE